MPHARHRDVHYALIAREIAEHALALAPSRDARVLDYGCGEALHADVIAAACGQVLLCDGAPSVRARLASRFAGDANIRVLTPEEVARLAEHRLDLIVFHSVVQYLKPEEARALFLLFHRLLKSSGALLVSDVIPPQVSYDTSAAALLRFGASEGFLFAALASLMRTVFSDYRQSRRRFGFTRFSEAAMLENLAAAGFAAAREPKNMGHDQTRMAFIARKFEWLDSTGSARQRHIEPMDQTNEARHPASAQRSANRPASAAGAGAGLSIVVPLYNEALSLGRLHAKLADVAHSLKAGRSLACEVVYVDDGSSDGTLAIARTLPASGLDVQVVSLSRNFGKEAALLAGLDHARLGAVAFINGDGQHPPSLIETLAGHWLDNGRDVVCTAKAHRADESVTRRIAVKCFYLLLNWGLRTKIPEDAGDFRLLSPRAAAALRQMPERNRFFEGLASWIGFRQMRILYEPAPRTDGRSTWTFRSLIGLSLNGLTSFSVAPLRTATMLGLLLAVAALLYGAQILYQTLVYGADVPGYPSLLAGVMVLGGVQLIMLGVLGEYVGKILSEIKARPLYFVAEHELKRGDETRADTSSSAVVPP